MSRTPEKRSVRAAFARLRLYRESFPFWPEVILHEPPLLAFPQNYGNNNSMSDVVQSVRQLLQDFIAPELRELKGDVGRLESKMDSGFAQLDSKINSGLANLESKTDSGLAQLESKMDSGFYQLRSLIENANLRAELEATRDIANLRERVTRLETERGINRQ